jgi:hypothetical protein
VGVTLDCESHVISFCVVSHNDPIIGPSSIR